MLDNRLGMLLRMAFVWRSHIWYKDYKKQIRENKTLKVTEPIDVMFLMVDHYEPAKKDGSKAVDKVRDWCDNYRDISKNFMDSDGVHPQHSWFYRYDFSDFKIINEMSKYVYDEFGEIEFHLHHAFDTSDTFNDKIERGLHWFNSSGAMISSEKNPQKRFAYIAGNWALDNGRNDPQYSGVNNEISILKNHGCYADFTFPAIECTAQPKKVNAIYYATDDPQKPKSYNTGVNVKVGREKSGDLMIVEGPLFVDWQNNYLESAAFEFFAPYKKDRLKYWKNAHVHVKGRPEWIFIKLHTHGMQSTSIFKNGDFKKLCLDLDSVFNNDGYRLHYVTSREAYNIIKAAEDGLSGNPNEFRDYCIKKPVNKKLFCNKPYTLISYSNKEIKMKIEKNISYDTEIRFKETPVASIKGNIYDNFHILFRDNDIQDMTLNGEGSFKVTFYETGKEFTNILPYNVNRYDEKVK